MLIQLCDSIFIELKDEMNWVFRSNHVSLAFTVSERRHGKNFLMYFKKHNGTERETQ